LSEHRPVSGRDFVTALVVGVDVECRIGNAVYPKHYDVGWHITGTAGVFGAAAASGRLLGLSEQHMLCAIGLAATQPVGLQEMFGSMTKSFHPGRAAQSIEDSSGVPQVWQRRSEGSGTSHNPFSGNFSGGTADPKSGASANSATFAFVSSLSR
jgi:hypothetical protein